MTLVSGQDFAITDWSEGAVTLSSGEIISGSVFYHVKAKTVYVEVEDETRSLKASKVLRFNFYDKDKKKERRFISIPMEVPNRPVMRAEFLEVIKDFKEYVILSQLSSRKVVLPAHRYTPAQTITQIVEHWYIIDEQGVKHLYLSFMDRSLMGPKLEFFNSMLFKVLIFPDEKEIRSYGVAKKLNPENPNDNLLLLEYNAQLKKTRSKNSTPAGHD